MNKINKYNYGKIYKICEVNKNGEKNIIYIGSTVQKLNNRFSYHLKSATYINDEKYQWKMYKYMRQQGINKFNIDLIINYNCKNEYELKEIEYEYIKLFKPKFNFIKSFEEEKKIFRKSS